LIPANLTWKDEVLASRWGMRDLWTQLGCV